MKSSLALALLVAGILIGSLATRGCAPHPEVRTDSVFVVRLRHDTVALPVFYVSKLQGVLHRDTVTRISGDTVYLLANAGAFSVDSIVNGDTIHADVVCDSAQVRNLWIRHSPVVVSVADTFRDVRTETVTEESHTLALTAFAEADMLKIPTEGLHLSSMGLTGTLTIGAFTAYLQPSYDFQLVDRPIPSGLALSLGLSYTLWEK